MKPQSHADAPPDEILNTAGAAKFLHCSVQTLEQLRVRGDGPPFSKLGRRLIRYRRSALITYLAQREVASTSAAEAPK